MASHLVKFQSVTLEISPWKHNSGAQHWRFSYYTPEGKRMAVTRSTLARAKQAALDKAKELAKGTLDLNSLTAHQIRGIKRILEVDPQMQHVEEFITWHTRKYPVKALDEAVNELIAIVERNKGDSIQNLRTLRKNLIPVATAFTGRDMKGITPLELNTYLSDNPGWGNRTRKNIRASIVTLFRWAQSNEFLPEGKTAAEKVPTPIIKKKTPKTWSPEQMEIMLRAVRPEYLSWLAVTAFGGFRTDEIYPLAGGTKIPLDWGDFHWDRDIIIVRDETSKTGRRIVPILPALRALLWPIRKESGPVGGASAPPTKLGRGKGAIAETKRLGALVGGWKPNAIRHSWISYRAAEVGIGQTSLEAGNSESEAKASYNDAKSREEAGRWFGIHRNLEFEKVHKNKGTTTIPTHQRSAEIVDSK